MKRNIVFFILLVLSFSLLTACSNKVEEQELVTNEMYEIDKNGETFLSEEYQSYITSVQSQLNKKYNSEFIFQGASTQDLARKYYFVTFIEKDTNVVVNCECVRNNIKNEDYQIAKLAYDLKTEYANKIAFGNYMKGFDIDYERFNNYVNIDFEIKGDVTEYNKEDVLFDSRYKKLLKVNIDTRYIRDFECTDNVFVKAENNLKSFGTIELTYANNFEIVENFIGCGTVNLFRNNEKNATTVKKFVQE